LKPLKKHKWGVTSKQARRQENVVRRRQAGYETDPYLARQKELLRLDQELYRLMYGPAVKAVW